MVATVVLLLVWLASSLVEAKPFVACMLGPQYPLLAVFSVWERPAPVPCPMARSRNAPPPVRAGTI
jgi:hypothetical protein